MKDLVFLYAYLFPCKSKTNIKDDVPDNNKLPPLVEHKTTSFPENKCLYKYEIYPETLMKILKPIIFDKMVCLNVFCRGAFTYVCLVSHILHIILKYF